MQQGNKVLTLDWDLFIIILWITTGHLKSCSHFLVFSQMSPSYWLSRFTQSVHCSCKIFPLLLEPSCVSFPVSAQPNGVQDLPLVLVIGELTMKQISNTRNSPKYTFAESRKFVLKALYRLWAMTSKRGGRHSFFGSNRKKKHTKWRTFKYEKQPRISGKFKAFREEWRPLQVSLSLVDNISKIIGHRKLGGFLPSLFL